MFRRSRKAPQTTPRGQGAETKATKATARFLVSCVNGCTALECTSLQEAEAFQRNLCRCSRCGADLLIRK